MSVREALDECLDHDGPAPTLDALGGEGAFGAAVGGLDARYLPLLAEVVTQEAEAFDDLGATLCALGVRLPEIEGALSFANTADDLLFLAAKCQDGAATRAFRDGLLLTLRESGEVGLRSGPALRTLVDLALLDIGMTTAPVVAFLEDLEEVPTASASSFIRAIGTLAEHVEEAQDKLLMERVGQVVDANEEAVADAQVEFGWRALREAFAASGLSDQQTLLAEAQRNFEHAAKNDEDRPDATVFAAGAACMSAFLARSDFVKAFAHLQEAKREWTLYATTQRRARDDRAFRNIAAWHVFAAELQQLHEAGETDELLRVEKAVGTLALAYSGSRIRVFDNPRLSVDRIVAPAIEQRVRDNALLAKAMAELAEREPTNAGATALGKVVRPKAQATAAPRHQKWRLRLA